MSTVTMEMRQALCTVVGIYSCSLFAIQAERVQCGDVISSETRRHVDAYVCPTKFHREKENRCCNPPRFNCCREPTFLENHLTAVLSTAIIVIFALLTMIIIVCLCWEKCLLHKIIRKKPALDYMARPEETEYLSGLSLPNEYCSEKHAYEVNAEIIYRPNKDPL
ncbi:hypothetical protein X798_04963 [Onchocerca flexuosa]|uniref:Uncharacterized protein n=1 Tax=Onchocerca flexuosa TaxID=387005 RepID=A0A238BRH6_9BILA|nr:hypothetical protein X798_04963 [Onchocerca flexuosa]